MKKLLIADDEEKIPLTEGDLHIIKNALNYKLYNIILRFFRNY